MFRNRPKFGTALRVFLLYFFRWSKCTQNQIKTSNAFKFFELNFIIPTVGFTHTHKVKPPWKLHGGAPFTPRKRSGTFPKIQAHASYIYSMAPRSASNFRTRNWPLTESKLTLLNVKNTKNHAKKPKNNEQVKGKSRDGVSEPRCAGIYRPWALIWSGLTLTLYVTLHWPCMWPYFDLACYLTLALHMTLQQPATLFKNKDGIFPPKRQFRTWFLLHFANVQLPVLLFFVYLMQGFFLVIRTRNIWFCTRNIALEIFNFWFISSY